MKMIYGIIGFLIIGGLIFFMTSCNKKRNKKNNSIRDSEKSNIMETKVKENPYTSLIKQSLSITPEQLKLNLDNSKTIAYGIIMEWDVSNSIVSVVSFKTGDASVYISTGQIFIGGYAHENIINSAKKFVEHGQEYLILAKETTETPEPDKGCVRFYFLTNKGKFYLQDTYENIENNKSDLSKLFELGNNVITEYRQMTENK